MIFVRKKKKKTTSTFQEDYLKGKEKLCSQFLIKGDQ